jgi:hypothetical protein
MTWEDPIVAELHEIRRRLANEHGNDLKRIVDNLNQQPRPGRQAPVSYPPKRPAGWIERAKGISE